MRRCAPWVVILMSSRKRSIGGVQGQFSARAVCSDNHAFEPSDSLAHRRMPALPYPLWLSLVIFVGLFFILQWAWGKAHDTGVERLIIHDATVRLATTLVNLLTPEAGARAVGARIKASGGGLNILNGCEGTEIMFLLIAAFAAVRLTWRRTLVGLGLGLVLVFALNQLRILVLFYAFRNERNLFDLLHTSILPALLVAAVALYFYAVLHRDRMA